MSQKGRNPEVVKQTAFIQAERLQLLMYISEPQTHKFYSFLQAVPVPRLMLLGCVSTYVCLMCEYVFNIGLWNYFPPY